MARGGQGGQREGLEVGPARRVHQPASAGWRVGSTCQCLRKKKNGGNWKTVLATVRKCTIWTFKWPNMEK